MKHNITKTFTFKNIILSFLLLFVISAPLFLTTSSLAQNNNVTISNFNPFGNAGIKCLYYFQDINTANIAGNQANPTGCVRETALLNRLEIFLFSLSPILAVISLMIGGYKYMQDGFTEKSQGIKYIQGAIVGMIVVISAYVVRNVVFTIFVGENGNGVFGGSAAGNTINTNGGYIFLKNLLLGQIIQGLLIPIAIPIAVFYLIWSGYKLITAGGSPKAIGEAMKGIQNAIIGLIIIVLAIAIISIVQRLSGSFLNSVVPAYLYHLNLFI
jgi:Type IV secretion system pilin